MSVEVGLGVLTAVSAIAVAVVRYMPRSKGRDEKVPAAGITKREFDGFREQVNKRFDSLAEDVRELRRWLNERF